MGTRSICGGNKMRNENQQERWFEVDILRKDLLLSLLLALLCFP